MGGLLQGKIRLEEQANKQDVQSAIWQLFVGDMMLKDDWGISERGSYQFVVHLCQY